MTEQAGPVLIIAGMHRSGTSLLAATLKEAGLDLGSRFRPGDASNSRGYHENIDFVELHYEFFRHHGISEHGWTLESGFSVPAHLRQRAQQTVIENRRCYPWGWKDPRTTLFLDFWADLVPEARFLFVFRAPWEVIDSLFRRGDDVFQQDPVLALKIWEHYNRLALDFFRRYPGRCLVVDVNTVQQDAPALIEAIRDRLSVPLAVPGREVFESSLFTRDRRDSQQPNLVRACYPSAYRLWLELRDSASPDRTGEREAGDAGGSGTEDFGPLMLEYWMKARIAQLERAEAERQTDRILYDTRSSLYHAQRKLESIEKSRIWKLRNRLDAIRSLFRPAGV